MGPHATAAAVTVAAALRARPLAILGVSLYIHGTACVNLLTNTHTLLRGRDVGRGPAGVVNIDTANAHDFVANQHLFWPTYTSGSKESLGTIGFRLSGGRPSPAPSGAGGVAAVIMVPFPSADFPNKDLTRY